jgi:hypothetical protein
VSNWHKRKHRRLAAFDALMVNGAPALIARHASGRQSRLRHDPHDGDPAVDGNDFTIGGRSSKRSLALFRPPQFEKPDARAKAKCLRVPGIAGRNQRRFFHRIAPRYRMIESRRRSPRLRTIAAA